LTYNVLATDIVEGMVIFHRDHAHRVVDVCTSIPSEIGLTLLQVGRTDPKMFYAAFHPKNTLTVSLKHLLKKL